MYTQRRRIFSQNFLHDRKLIKELLRKSSIASHDIVLEIGPGKGIITEQLIRKSKKVIAVEIDAALYSYLKEKFKSILYSAERKVQLDLYNKDFINFKLPKFSYKVFANIPFSIEGKIIRKLLQSEAPPEEAYLVMRKDLAERLMGKYKEGQFSIFYKPWFEFDIIHNFRRTDFTPYARMDTVLLKFSKKKNPLLSPKDKRKYSLFIGQGFGGGKRLSYNLRIFFTKRQFQKLSQQLHFSVKAMPSDLKLENWIGLFEFFTHNNDNSSL